MSYGAQLRWGTYLNKVLQLFSDFLGQLRASDPLWNQLVVHDPDLGSSSISLCTWETWYSPVLPIHRTPATADVEIE